MSKKDNDKPTLPQFKNKIMYHSPSTCKKKQGSRKWYPCISINIAWQTIDHSSFYGMLNTPPTSFNKS
jgi:hypothetical protein